MAKKDRDKEKEIDKEENKELDEEKEGGKGGLALVTVLIIIIWLGIIAILIKTDVGGFGSTVLYPILKDVPYINKILPDKMRYNLKYLQRFRLRRDFSLMLKTVKEVFN